MPKHQQGRNDAWQREFAFIRARLSQSLPHATRIWNRGSLYDERLPSPTGKR
ncbi:MAG: hypothetical protein ABFD96_02535 [Armatimonadia bacterium]